MKRTAIALTMLAMAIQQPTPASAHGLPDDATYGVCFTHIDARFPETLGGFAQPGAAVSEPAHWHLAALRLDDFTSLIGKCAQMSFYKVTDPDGQEHHFAYLPKDEPFIEFVSEQDAMIGANEGDNYNKASDGSNRAGCNDVGSTEAQKGNSNGDCSQ